MPRQNRRQRDDPGELEAEGIGRGATRTESGPDGDWLVRPITGAAATKTYRCPGCDQEIRPGTPHVVSWPAYARDSDLDPWDTDSAADRRRHWHTACWRARGHRR
jgi:hypothetical protein